jgi:hypothetical protein
MAMDEPSPTSALSASQLQREIDRCRREVAEVERLLRTGHPDVHGLCLGLKDWSVELRILEREQREWKKTSSE